MMQLNTFPLVRFARHYAEMVLAMAAGMLVLGPILVGAATIAGVTLDELEAHAPAVLLLGMAFTMCAPMTALMRRRGHAWRPVHEMNASMIVPTLAAIGLLGAGAVDDVHAAMGLQHLAMFPAMLVAMVLRRDEYTGDHRHAHGPRR